MANHTPEPWKHIDYGDYGAIVGADGSEIASNLDYYPVCVSDDNQLRIVACVNACAGISNETLESIATHGLAKAAQHLATVTAQRDELLQTMRQIAFATAPEPDDGSWHENAYSLAMDAIEKFEVKNG